MAGKSEKRPIRKSTMYAASPQFRGGYCFAFRRSLSLLVQPACTHNRTNVKAEPSRSAISFLIRIMNFTKSCGFWNVERVRGLICAIISALKNFHAELRCILYRKFPARSRRDFFSRGSRSSESQFVSVTVFLTDKLLVKAVPRR